MRGNLTVLGILGLFLIGAIWITLWAPEIPARTDRSASVSWLNYQIPTSPIRDLGPRDVAKLEVEARSLKRRIRRIKNKQDSTLLKLRAKLKEVQSKLELAAKQIAEGKQLYADYCVQCHGEQGKGDGFAAEFLELPPRNLFQANYRFKTTAQGKLPTDADLFRTLSLGARRTPMPGFAAILDADRRWSLIQYLKTLSRKWNKARFYDHGPPIETLLGQPPKNLDSPRLQRLAARSYKDSCARCHGEQGYGDGDSAAEQRDTSAGGKIPLRPRNFHQPWMFKRGHTLPDIALTIALGLDSTGMPSHGPPDPLTREAIWATAQYVLNFSKHIPNPKLTRSKPAPFPGRPTSFPVIRARAWQFEQLIEEGKDPRRKQAHWISLVARPIKVAQGELVLLRFQPADNGTGRGQGLAIAGYEASVYLTGVTVGRPVRIVFRATKAGTFRIYNPMQTAPGPVLARMTGKLIVQAAATGKK